MKKQSSCLCFTLVLVCLLLRGTSLYAQKNEKEISQNHYANGRMVVDGQVNEWPEPAWRFNKASLLSFALANDDTTLYIAIKTAEKTHIRRILMNGLQLSFNASGKRKGVQSISLATLRPAGRTSKDPTTWIKAELAAIKEIRVWGFNQILDGGLALNNEFGIRARASMGDEGELFYEYALPMKLLQIDPLKNDIFALQIRLNGLSTMTISGLRDPRQATVMNANPMGRAQFGNKPF